MKLKRNKVWDEIRDRKSIRQRELKFYFLSYFLNFGRGENVDMNRFHLKMIWIIKIRILNSKVTK